MILIRKYENNTNYGVNKDTGANYPDAIKYDTRVLKPNLCDYADAYILVDGAIRLTAAGVGDNDDARAAAVAAAVAANAVTARLALKILHHLLNVIYKLMMNMLIQQKI